MYNQRRLNLTKFILLRQIGGSCYHINRNKYYVVLPRNWDEINDKHTRKQGFINMAMILIYALVVIGAIAAAIYIGQNLSVQI